MPEVSIPPAYTMHNPTIQALHKLGGSGTNAEIHDEVAAILGLSDEQIQKPYTEGSNKRKFFERLAWVKTRLKRYGLIENSSRGIWSLTKEGLATTEVDGKEVERVARKLLKQEKLERPDDQSADSDDEAEDLAYFDESASDETWRAELHALLLEIDPSAFERLFQRVLRESGFTQVDVTGRSGDGGIDGIGVVRLGGFLSFRVLFQCKRWKGSIGAGTIRDFRGAMMGRTDKGLIVATGSFTPAAIREATRDGAPEIDLIDGEQLIDKLKELSLGVNTEPVIVEKVTINPDFFANI